MTGSVALLRSKPGGGATWLQALRSVPYAEAAEALCTLPGIGPKARPKTLAPILTQTQHPDPDLNLHRHDRLLQ